MNHTSSLLQKARQYEQEHAAQITTSQRPLFHLTPQIGWMNDPNGFCYYKGQYHLFYQYYPYDRVWGPMHWGHAVSSDLLHWQYFPAALAPDTPADQNGCFSGGATPMPDGQLLLVYTGVRPDPAGGPDLQAQCVAIGNGMDFEKQSGNPVIDAGLLPKGYSAHDFRDPKVWQENGLYHCVAVSDHPQNRGSALLFESEDGLHWQFCTVLAASNGQLGGMWECPDLFALDDTQVLVVSPMEMQPDAAGEFKAGKNTMALLGCYDPAAARFTPQAAQRLDHGLEFYAPQTTLAPDGRRILISWLESWESCDSAPRTAPWFGRMTLPRQLKVQNGRLYQNPVQELEALWQNTVCHTGVFIPNSKITLQDIRGRCIDLHVTLRLAESPACSCFVLRFAQNEQYFTQITYRAAQQRLEFDRSHSGCRRNGPHDCAVTVCPEDGALTLRLILDTDSAELFINHGQRTMSCLLDTPAQAEGITFCAEGGLWADVVMHTLG